MRTKKEVISIRLDKEVMNLVKAQADAEGISISKVCRRFVNMAVKGRTVIDIDCLVKKYERNERMKFGL